MGLVIFVIMHLISFKHMYVLFRIGWRYTRLWLALVLDISFFILKSDSSV